MKQLRQNKRLTDYTEKADAPKDVASLRGKINEILNEQPNVDTTERSEAFFSLLSSKIIGSGLPEELVDSLADKKSKLFVGYDSSNPSDMVILNNKVNHIAQLELSGDYALRELSEIAFQILKTKH